jgi:hypothetical protein
MTFTNPQKRKFRGMKSGERRGQEMCPPSSYTMIKKLIVQKGKNTK